MLTNVLQDNIIAITTHIVLTRTGVSYVNVMQVIMEMVPFVMVSHLVPRIV